MENKEYISAEEKLFKVPYETLHMGEDITGEEEDGMEQFSKYEIEAFQKFDHIIRQSNEVEQRLLAGAPQEMWWVAKDDNGKVTSKSLMWRESWTLVNELRQTSYEMFAGHEIEDPETGGVTHVPGFRDDPRLREAANQILNEIHQEKEQARQFEIAELNHMMDIP